MSTTVWREMATIGVGFLASLLPEVVGGGEPEEEGTSPRESAPDSSNDLPVSTGGTANPCGVAKITLGGRDRFFTDTGKEISKDEFNEAVRNCGKGSKGRALGGLNPSETGRASAINTKMDVF